MDFEDRLATVDVGRVDDDLPVETARTQQGPVEHFRAVGRTQNQHADVRLEAVHLGQQLVESLLALVVDEAHVHAALRADRVDFVDENNAGGVLLRLLEQVADPRGPHAHEHLDKVAAAEGKERHVGFAGDRPGQQRFAGARRTDEQDALGDFRAERFVAGRVLEEVDHFLQLVFGFVAAGHVVEGDARVLVGNRLRLALADAHHRLAHRPHSPRQEVPDPDEKQERQDPGEQERGQHAGTRAHELDVMRHQLVDQFRILDPDGAEQERSFRGGLSRRGSARDSSVRRCGGSFDCDLGRRRLDSTSAADGFSPAARFLDRRAFSWGVAFRGVCVCGFTFGAMLGPPVAAWERSFPRSRPV